MKVDEYTFRRIPRDVREFAEQVTLLLNNGKYSSQVVGTPPTWTARNGEFVFFSSSGTLRTYFYNNGLWNYIEYNTAGAVGGSPGGANTQVQVNSQGTFYGDSGLTYIASSALTVGRDMLFILNNNSGSNTYFLYRSSNTYLEYYINGELRLQI